MKDEESGLIVLLDSIMEKLDSTTSYIQIWSKNFRAKVSLLALLGLILLPFATQNLYYLGIFITPMIYTIFAGSWDFLAGYAGQVSFGHGVFFGISGYISSFFIVSINLPWFLALIVGAIAGVIVGLVIGVPSLRLKGPYLALATLTFSLILFQLFLMPDLEQFLGGTHGVTGVPPISSNPIIVYYICLLIMVICVIIMLALGRSNLGTIFKAIRDDDKGVKSSGINTAKYKIYAFMISGFFAGIAGGLYSMHNRGINPSIFLPLQSFYAIVLAALGGISTISGAAMGSFLFWLLYELLRDFQEISLLLLAIILILVIRFAEEGLLKPTFERLKDLWDLLIGK